jgi:cAMP-binding proteins - catabolite gene activator and regulatory subunit of cAMP-dependent protein kinases
VRQRPALRARLEDCRHARYDLLRADLEAAQKRAEAKAAERRTFTPEELVERFPLFAGLTPEQREVLVLHFEPQTAEPGVRVIRAGDEADKVYFIASGEAEVATRGRRIRLGPGDYFGEMALLNDAPRSADVTATDYSRFATLSRRDFREFLRRYPDIREKMAAIASERMAMNAAAEAEGEQMSQS